MNINNFKIGDRVKLVYTDDKYTELKPGDKGTIENINQVQINIKWDSGSNLNMLPDTDDLIEVIDNEN